MDWYLLYRTRDGAATIVAPIATREAALHAARAYRRSGHEVMQAGTVGGADRMLIDAATIEALCREHEPPD